MNRDHHRAPATPGPIEVTRLPSLDDIRQFSATWQALLAGDSRGSLFQSPQMFFAWQQATEEPEEPWFLVASIRGAPVGCAPLVRKTSVWRGLRLRTLAFGNPRANFVIAGHRAEVPAAFAGYLRSRAGDWDVLALEDVLAGSGTVETVLRVLASGRGYRWRTPQPARAEAYLDASGTWDGYLSAKGRHFRHSLKYQCRRIERLGPVTYRQHNRPEDANGALDRLFAMEARSWKAVSGSRLSAREAGCFRILARGPGEHVAYDTLFLEVGDETMAGLLSFRHRHCCYLFVTYYDERVRDLYPGRPLFREALRRAFERQDIAEVSFVGSYPYAMSWCDQVRAYQSVDIHGPGWRARLAETLGRWCDRPSARAAEELQHA
jgi:CelD/BcsL family acetyltransferase involved in cellulose biosynthesis